MNTPGGASKHVFGAAGFDMQRQEGPMMLRPGELFLASFVSNVSLSSLLYAVEGSKGA